MEFYQPKTNCVAIEWNLRLIDPTHISSMLFSFFKRIWSITLCFPQLIFSIYEVFKFCLFVQQTNILRSINYSVMFYYQLMECVQFRILPPLFNFKLDFMFLMLLFFFFLLFFTVLIVFWNILFLEIYWNFLIICIFKPINFQKIIIIITPFKNVAILSKRVVKPVN